MADIQDYGMFTDAGNIMVGCIVAGAKTANLTWSQVYDMLHTISRIEEYGEATDTAVREVVYDAIGAGERDENFWV